MAEGARLSGIRVCVDVVVSSVIRDKGRGGNEVAGCCGYAKEACIITNWAAGVGVK